MSTFIKIKDYQHEKLINLQKIISVEYDKANCINIHTSTGVLRFVYNTVQEAKMAYAEIEKHGK